MLSKSLEASRRKLLEVFGSEPFNVAQAMECLSVSRSLLSKVLHELARQGHLRRLGRGLYVFNHIERHNHPQTSPLSAIGRRIHAALQPEGLNFAITGLDVLLPFTHHLLVRFPHLVYVERGAAEWAKETLRREALPCLIEPTSREIHIGLELTEAAELIIVRETSDFYGVEAGVATLERALVDLYVESTHKGYPASVDEVGRILFNVLRSADVNYSRLLRWAMRRGVEAELREVLAKFAAYLVIPDAVLKGKRERTAHTAAMSAIAGLGAR